MFLWENGIVVIEQSKVRKALYDAGFFLFVLLGTVRCPRGGTMLNDAICFKAIYWLKVAKETITVVKQKDVTMR